MAFKPQGIITAMVTPFKKGGGEVDYDKVGEIADYLIEQGAQGLFVCGTTGEGPLLSPDERERILEEALYAVGKKAVVIAHTAGRDANITIELTRHAQKAGAAAAAIVAPYYYTYDDEALAQYYKTVAKAAPKFPIMLYNIPGCAKNALSAELVLGLADEVDNIVGIKDSSGSMGLLTRLIGNAPKGFHVINGADDYGYQAFLAGVPAAVSGTANAVPELYCGVYDEIQRGTQKKAWKLQVQLEEACRIFGYGGKVAVFKETMRMRGIDPGAVRPPQRELTRKEKQQLKKDLEAAGLL